MNEYELIQEGLSLIKKDLDLEDKINISKSNPREDLHRELSRIISYLLDHDMNRLLVALYRIDVSEHKVKHVLAHSPSDLLAKDIADLVIERELLKASYRIKYKTN